MYGDLFLTELVTKVKPKINSDEVHPQLSNTRHPVDGARVGAVVNQNQVWFQGWGTRLNSATYTKPGLGLEPKLEF